MQVVEAVAPRTSEYVPAAQSVHTAVPVASAYDPPGQGMQTVEPATEYCPNAQPLHVTEEVAPTAVEYVPAAHS